jgi:LPXTG-site transpeptidase (sortase) family protein
MLERPFSFALTFLALFALLFAFLWKVDLLPNSLTGETSHAPAAQEEPAGPAIVPAVTEEPVRVEAKTIGLNKTVLNPDSTDVEALDAALLKGAVRYPTSALLGQQGTMLLFGHSSYLPVVHNQNYKAFDGIQNLHAGDIVSVYSATAEYRYAVKSVATATADEDQVLRISLPEDGTQLMLVTCDSFGTKSTRFVVTADFEGAYAL